MSPTHYETLGVAKTASEAELKAAYRDQAKKYHPDRNPGDAAAEARFKDVGEAYDVLKGSISRAAYDRQISATATEIPVWQGADQWWPDGPEPPAQSWARPPPPAPGPRPAAEPPHPARGPAPRRRSGSDLSAEVAATLEEIFAGFRMRIGLEVSRTCPACHGAGGLNTGTILCPSCGGRRRGLFGFGGCATCNGLGRIPQMAACTFCRGDGSVKVTLDHAVPIPAGSPDGSIIEDILPDGRSLFVTVRVKRHRRFTCRGHDLILNRKVSASRAERGTSLSLVGINGTKLKVKVRPGTQDGTLLRVAGHGMPRSAYQRGDLLVRIQRT